jgi:hypothetical protein
VRCRSTAARRPSSGAQRKQAQAHDKEKALLAEIIARGNDLFEGDLTDGDRLVYVNNVLKGKLLESETLVEQAANNSKEQFANSPEPVKRVSSCNHGRARRSLYNEHPGTQLQAGARVCRLAAE